MYKYILPALLLASPVFGEPSILIENKNQRYVIIPDCYISEDVEDIKVRRLHVGAPIHIKYKNKQVRCQVQKIIKE